MNILYSIDFDIVIVAVILFNLVSGIRGGIKTQIKKTVSTAIPVIILIFTLSPVDQLLSRWTGFEAFFEKVCTFLGMSPFMNTIRSLIVAWAIYLVGWSLVRLAFYIFGNRRIVKRALEITRWWSRVAGAVLSIINSYLLLTLFFLILGTVLSVSYVTPLTKAFNTIQIPGYSISQLSQYENIYPGYYNEIEEAYNKVSGDTLKDYYDGYQHFVSIYDDINTELDNFYVSLTSSEQATVTKAKESLTAIKNDNMHLYLMKKNNKTLLEHLTVWSEFEPLIQYVYSIESYVRIIDLMGNKDYDSLETFYDMIVGVESELLASFNYAESETVIEDVIINYTYYQSHHALLDKYLNNPESLEAYNQAFQKTFTSEKTLASFSYLFLKDYNKRTARDELYEVYILVENFEAYRSYFNLLSSELSIPEMMALLPYAKSFYSDKTWEKSSMLTSYINDAVANTVTPGHRLYTDYLMSRSANRSLGLTEDINHILTTLKELNEAKTITNASYLALINNICLEKEGIFRRKLRAGMYTAEELKDLYQAMSSYYTNEQLAQLKMIITYQI